MSLLSTTLQVVFGLTMLVTGTIFVLEGALKRRYTLIIGSQLLVVGLLLLVLTIHKRGLV